MSSDINDRQKEPFASICPRLAVYFRTHQPFAGSASHPSSIRFDSSINPFPCTRLRPRVPMSGATRSGSSSASCTSPLCVGQSCSMDGLELVYHRDMISATDHRRTLRTNRVTNSAAKPTLRLMAPTQGTGDLGSHRRCQRYHHRDGTVVVQKWKPPGGVRA